MIDMRLLNRPVQLHWAGWVTDTFRLGQAGWQISAEQDVQYNCMRIAINHPKAQVQGISNIEEFLFRDMMNDKCHSSLPTMLRFEDMSRQIHINTIRDTEAFPIDFRPLMIEQEIKSLNDFANFATIVEEPKNEIYLREASINQILEMALQQQEPEQERIRQEMIREQELRSLRMGTLHTELRLIA